MNNLQLSKSQKHQFDQIYMQTLTDKLTQLKQHLQTVDEHNQTVINLIMGQVYHVNGIPDNFNKIDKETYLNYYHEMQMYITPQNLFEDDLKFKGFREADQDIQINNRWLHPIVKIDGLFQEHPITKVEVIALIDRYFFEINDFKTWLTHQI